jgi:cytochrome c-type biogenesis protein CcmF
VGAFLSSDFEVAYVAAHSNLAMPRVYTWVAFYAGNEGSLLYIAFALSVLSALALLLSPRQVRDTLPYVGAILMLVLSFFLAVMLFMADPFARLAVAPLDGQGINPLLTHPGMFIHPPVMMVGLVGVTIPFSFALGALLAGRTGDEWVDPGRTWGIIAWAALGSGLLLGAWWAYTILGWGGYWAWDPVENAGFMPFVGLTAFIHSIMVQKRRGMFRMWNIVLINVAFGLALYGMFMNRGGPVPSVHSFGASTLGWVFLMFTGIGVAVPFAVFFMRYASLKSAQHLESSLSREAAFLVNNLLLLAIAFVTLWGVVFPLISEVFRGRTVSIAAPFYNQVNGPLMLALVFFMGVGPLLPWRRASLRTLRGALLGPALISVAVVVLLAGLGVRKPYPLAAFALCALVASGILLEGVRGTRARHRQGDGYAVGFLRLVASNRPRYGGYVVHLAVVILALGVVGSKFYDVQREAVLAPGERVEIGGYEIQYVDTTVTQMADRTESVTTLDAYKNGAFLGTLTARRDFYPAFRMSSTRAGIRSTPVEDLYVIPSETLDDGTSGFRVMVNPMVWWIWVAGPVFVLGTVIALWPSRSRAPSPVRESSRRAVAPPGQPRVTGEAGTD